MIYIKLMLARKLRPMRSWGATISAPLLRKLSALSRSSNSLSQYVKQEIVLNSRELSAILARLDQFVSSTREGGALRESIGMAAIVASGAFFLCNGPPKYLSPFRKQDA